MAITTGIVGATMGVLAYRAARDVERAQEAPRNVQDCRETERRLDRAWNVSLDAKRYDEAHADFAKALDLAPTWSAPNVGRGQARIAGGRNEDAPAAFEDALRIDARDVIAAKGGGDALLDLRRNEEALAAFDAAIALDGAWALSHFGRACALVALGRFEDALPSVDRALELDPGFDATRVSRDRARAALDHGVTPRDGAYFFLPLTLATRATGALAGVSSSLRRLAVDGLPDACCPPPKSLSRSTRPSIVI